MSNPRYCTECGSTDTERVHTEHYRDLIEEIRICNECPTQFTNKFSFFESETDSTEEIEA